MYRYEPGIEGIFTTYVNYKIRENIKYYSTRDMRFCDYKQKKTKKQNKTEKIRWMRR